MGTGFCERIDLNISLALPADAPQGHPHLLKTEGYKSKQAKVLGNLSLVDVLATIIFDWNPAALHHLLNMEKDEFYCDVDWGKDSLKDSTPKKLAKFVYIHRLGEYVRVAIVGPDSDSEISYRICNDGKWEIKSAQRRRSRVYNKYCVTGALGYLGVCENIEKEMARDMAERFLVEGVLEDIILFPMWRCIP